MLIILYILKKVSQFCWSCFYKITGRLKIGFQTACYAKIC